MRNRFLKPVLTGLIIVSLVSLVWFLKKFSVREKQSMANARNLKF